MRGISGPWVPHPARPTVATRRQRPVRAPVAPVTDYTRRVDGLAIVGGQILGVIPANGAFRGQVGPAGLGTLWYPASVTVDTSVSPFDTNSAVNVYVGPSLQPTTLIGSIPLGGTGVVALALPSLSPGLYIIVDWSGATVGSTVSANVVGTMSSLTRPGR